MNKDLSKNIKYMISKARLNFFIGFFVSLAMSLALLFNYLGFHFIAWGRCSPTMILFLLLVVLGVVYAFGGIGYVVTIEFDEDFDVSFLTAILASTLSSFAYMSAICIFQMAMAFISIVFLHDKYVMDRFFDLESFKFEMCVPATNMCLNVFGDGFIQQIAGIIFACIIMAIIFSAINSVVAIFRVFKISK